MEWLRKLIDPDAEGPLTVVPGSQVCLPPHRGEVLDGRTVDVPYQIHWLAREARMLAHRRWEKDGRRAIRNALPSWVVTESLYKAGANCMAMDEVVPEVPFMTVLDRWTKGRRHMLRAPSPYGDRL